MKKLVILLLAMQAMALRGQDSTNFFSFPIKNWDLQVVARENFYPTYLADPLGIRFGVSSQTMPTS